MQVLPLVLKFASAAISDSISLVNIQHTVFSNICLIQAKYHSKELSVEGLLQVPPPGQSLLHIYIIPDLLLKPMICEFAWVFQIVLKDSVFWKVTPHTLCFCMLRYIVEFVVDSIPHVH